jgi:polyphenol oxidase
VYNPAGELNLGFTPHDDPAAVEANRMLVAQVLTGDPATPIRTVRQIHCERSVVTAGGLWSPPEADGLISAEPGVLLAILTADCIPVLVADPVHHVVAAFHAGWRGTVARVVELGIARMVAEFGSIPANLQAAIGPGIGPCCYTVGDEVHSRFLENFSYGAELFHPSEGKLRLDLPLANQRQLEAAGLPTHAIQRVGGCTNCQPDLYFSHRADHGRTGRMMSVIGIRPAREQ